MNEIRLGLMGCGIVAKFRHLPAINTLPGIKKVSLFTPRIEVGRELAGQFGFENAFSDESAFWAAGLDVVVLTSPPGKHLQNIRSAAEHGVDVFCEKPIALSEDDCNEIRDIVQKSGIRLFVAFCFRFSPVSQKIRELIQSGAIGELRTLRLVFNWDCRGKYQDLEKKIPNPRREGRMNDGGPLVDCGVHLIDLARFWSGSEPLTWCGHGSWADDYPAPDHVWVHMDHANGVHTVAETSFSYGHQCKNKLSDYQYDIIGTDGVIRYDHEQSLFELQNADGAQPFPFEAEKDFDRMYEALVKALQTGDCDALPTCEDGIIATRIARSATEEAMIRRQRVRPPSQIS